MFSVKYEIYSRVSLGAKVIGLLGIYNGVRTPDFIRSEFNFIFVYTLDIQWDTSDRRQGKLLRMTNEKRAKKELKDSQLIIRIKRSERDAFVALCEDLDTSAAREIRRLIKEFTLSHTQAGQPDPESNKTEVKEPKSWPKKQKSKPLKKK